MFVGKIFWSKIRKFEPIFGVPSDTFSKYQTNWQHLGIQKSGEAQQ
jgi:hypothetical protein